MKASEVIRIEAEKNAWAHAYLFLGNDKVEINKLIKSFIALKECLPEDVITLSAAELDGKTISVEQVRNLLHLANLSPLGKNKIVIIYNAEKLNQSSGNILLKSLEEPARNTTFILAAENNCLLPTIVSRCRLIRISKSGSGISSEAEEFAALMSKNFYLFSAEIDKIIKEGRTNDFLAGLEEGFRYYLNARREKKFVSALEKILETRRKIKQNVAPRLALEVLMLNLKKAVKKL